MQVEVVYSKAEIYQQHAGNIQLIVNSYNLLLSSMADVELPLMLPKLELVDEVLALSNACAAHAMLPAAILLRGTKRLLAIMLRG